MGKLINNEKIFKRMVNVFIFLFVFNMVNKSFPFFGLDVRYITMPLGIIIISLSVHKSRQGINEVDISFTEKLVIVLYLFSIISAGIFVLSSKTYNPEVRSETISLIILYLYIIISIGVFVLNKKIIAKSTVVSYFNYSMFFSFVVILIIHFSYTFFEFVPGLFSQLPVSYSGSQFNFFLQNIRISGYSVDPNYVTLNAIIFLSLTYSVNTDFRNWYSHNKYKLYISLYLIFVSASKTIIVLAVSFLIFYFLLKKIKVDISYTLIIFCLLLMVLVLPIVLPNIFRMETMTTRFSLWNKAISLWQNHPILGNGLSSFRHYMSNYNWVVQSHSTLFQLLSECGIFGILIWFLITVRNAEYFRKINKGILFSYLVYFTWSFTYETMYLPYFIFFNILLVVIYSNSHITKKISVINVTNGLATGGAEKVVLDIADNLNLDFFNSTLLITDPTDITAYKDRLETSNFKTIDISNKKHDLIGNNIKIYNQLKNGEYDIVHTHQITLMYLLISQVFLPKIKYVHTIHSDAEKEFGSKIFRVYYHIIFVLFNVHVVSISKCVLSGARREYFLVKNRKMTLVYNGSETSDQRSNAKRKSDNTIKIICVGRLAKVKNYALVLEVAKELRKQNRDFTVSIFGEGELKNQILLQISEMDLNDIVYLKGVSDEIKNEMKNYDIFLMTSEFEGLGLAAIEAMSVGLPLVLTNFGPASELAINNYNGYVVENNDPVELSRCIIEIFDGDYFAFSNNSLKQSDLFTLDKMIRGYCDIYEQEKSSVN